MATHSRTRKKLKKARRNVMKDISPEKACKMLKEGTAHGRPLTRKQRGALGARCGMRGD